MEMKIKYFYRYSKNQLFQGIPISVLHTKIVLEKKQFGYFIYQDFKLSKKNNLNN